MLSTGDLKSPTSFSRDYVADQTTRGVVRLMNTSAQDFDVTLGHGCLTAVSAAWGCMIGGFDDQKIVATGLRYDSTNTSAGNEEIGVILRCQTMHSPNATYYFARIDSQVAKITKVIDGSFTTLTSQAFALPADTDIELTFSVVGNSLEARFYDGAALDVTLSTTDSEIPSGGIAGFKSGSSSIYCKSVTVEEL